MKLKAGHKYTLLLGLVITAVVLCTLPFLATKKEVIYIYTESPVPLSKEEGFIRELQRIGIKTIVNADKMPQKEDIGFWFKNPEYAKVIEKSPAKYNFLYTEAYYPIEWKNSTKQPIILTPYRELYEHYMRSNIKTAMITLGLNTADFYDKRQDKKYSLLYYGDNNKSSPLNKELKEKYNPKILGSFWDKKENINIIDNGLPKTRHQALSEAKIVIIYNEPHAPASKRISQEIMEAVMSGALVFSSPNKAVSELYGENIIIYDNQEDLMQKLAYYLAHYDKIKDKIISAQKVTLEKLSTSITAQRVKEIIDWLKNNKKN